MRNPFVVSSRGERGLSEESILLAADEGTQDVSGAVVAKVDA